MYIKITCKSVYASSRQAWQRWFSSPEAQLFLPLPLDSHPALPCSWSLLSGNKELGSSLRSDATGLVFDSPPLTLKCLGFKSIKRLSGVENLGQDYINL